MKYLIVILGLCIIIPVTVAVFLLMSYDFKVKPDFTKNGKDYTIQYNCVKSHTENRFGPHYGYSMMYGTFCWHTGSYTVNVCDSSVSDTIEVNIKNKKI